jgi:AAA+ ATPase superfamily predicted ATPase
MDIMDGLTLVGRQEEQRILQKALDSPEAEMVAVIGRRRVGKTFLVRSFFKEKIVFEMTGVRGISLEKQLENFSGRLKEASGSPLPIKQPTDWFEAFQLLEACLQPFLGDEKKVLFLDELPWMAGEKSDFVPALGYFWNSWASRKNLVVVICGSAASWMIENVINDTGGLYNRVTRRIFLEPFTLTETDRKRDAD